MYDEREKDESKAKQWVVSARDVDDVEREIRVAETQRRAKSEWQNERESMKTKWTSKWMS